MVDTDSSLFLLLGLETPLGSAKKPFPAVWTRTASPLHTVSAAWGHDAQVELGQGLSLSDRAGGGHGPHSSPALPIPSAPQGFAQSTGPEDTTGTG